MVQSLGLQKLVPKLHEFEQLETGIGNSKTLKFNGLLSKKHIPSAITYTVGLSNINFNDMCVDSPNYLRHF